MVFTFALLGKIFRMEILAYKRFVPAVSLCDIAAKNQISMKSLLLSRDIQSFCFFIIVYYASTSTDRSLG